MEYSFLLEGYGDFAQLIIDELLYYQNFIGIEGSQLEQLDENHVVINHPDFTRFGVLSIIFLRTPQRIELILLRQASDSEDYTELYNLARKIPWSNYFSHEKSFAVFTRSSSLDKIRVGKIVGQAIVDVFEESLGIRPKVNLKDPDIEVHVSLIKGEIFISIPLTHRKFNKPQVAAIHGILAWVFRENLVDDYICCFTSMDCEESKKFLVKTPHVERLVNMPIIDLLILDQQRTLELVSRFTGRKYKASKKLVKFPEDKSCSLLIANLFGYALSKSKQEIAFNRIIAHKQVKIFGIVMRNDITSLQKITNFKIQKLAKLNIEGCPANIVVMIRSGV